MDNGDIHYRPLPQQQAFLSHVLSHYFEDLLYQLVPFYKMAERQDGSGIGDVVFGKINPCEAADGAVVNQGVFHGFVLQGPPVLHQMNP